MPKLAEIQYEDEVINWNEKPIRIIMKNDSQLGEDTLKLFFRITENADFHVKCFDMQDRDLGDYNLGNIF